MKKRLLDMDPRKKKKWSMGLQVPALLLIISAFLLSIVGTIMKLTANLSYKIIIFYGVIILLYVLGIALKDKRRKTAKIMKIISVSLIFVVLIGAVIATFYLAITGQNEIRMAVPMIFLIVTILYVAGLYLGKKK